MAYISFTARYVLGEASCLHTCLTCQTRQKHLARSLLLTDSQYVNPEKLICVKPWNYKSLTIYSTLYEVCFPNKWLIKSSVFRSSARPGPRASPVCGALCQLPALCPSHQTQPSSGSPAAWNPFSSFTESLLIHPKTVPDFFLSPLNQISSFLFLPNPGQPHSCPLSCFKTLGVYALSHP